MYVSIYLKKFDGQFIAFPISSKLKKVLMVQTRSQSLGRRPIVNAAPNQVSLEQVQSQQQQPIPEQPTVAKEVISTKQVQKPAYPASYRGFMISGAEQKQTVDRFYELSINVSLKHNLDNRVPILSYYWKNPCHTYKSEDIIQQVNDMPLSKRIDEFTRLMRYDDTLDRFERLTEKYVTPKIAQISSEYARAKLSAGETRWVGVDLDILMGFYYWVNYVNALYVSIYRNLADNLRSKNDSMERAEILDMINRIRIIGKRFLTNEYALCQNYDVLRHSGLRTMLYYINNDGIESALYSFKAYCPQMVCDEIYPVVAKDTIYYNHPNLAIGKNDPDIGVMKAKYGKYYTM